MKRIRFLLPVLLLIVFSCSTDFDINGEWKDITIVYGLLDQSEDTAFIKINKAFLGEGDAMFMAQIQDSNEYQYKLEVRIDEYDTLNNFHRSFNLDTITVHDKKPGDFYYPTQTLYYALIDTLYPDKEYRLFIRNPKTGNTFSGKTMLVRQARFEKPKPSLKTIDFTESGTSPMEWTSTYKGRIYQPMIRFHYKEVSASAPTDTIYQVVEWPFPAYKSKYLNGNEDMGTTYSNPFFYDLLRSKIPVDASKTRYIGMKNRGQHDFGAVEFVLTVGSDELSTYLDVYAPSQGIVQEKPGFTNITGSTEAFGIFSSRCTYVKQLKLGDVTVSHIMNDVGRNFHSY